MTGTTIVRSPARLTLAVAFVVLIFVWGSPALAEVLFESRHELLSNTDNGDGTFAVSVQITLSNSTSDEYSSIVLVPAQSMHLLVAPGSPALQIDALSSGANVHVVWDFAATIPAEVLIHSRPLTFIGQAVDTNGDLVVLSVTSQYSATQ